MDEIDASEPAGGSADPPPGSGVTPERRTAVLGRSARSAAATQGRAGHPADASPVAGPNPGPARAEASLGPGGVRGRAGHDRGGGRRILATSGGSSAPGSGMSPPTSCVTSTQNTVAQRTADMDITGSVDLSAVRRSPSRAKARSTFRPIRSRPPSTLEASQESITEKELVSGGQAYMNVSVNGQAMSGLTGGAAVDRHPLPPAIRRLHRWHRCRPDQRDRSDGAARCDRRAAGSRRRSTATRSRVTR